MKSAHLPRLCCLVLLMTGPAALRAENLLQLRPVWTSLQGGEWFPSDPDALPGDDTDLVALPPAADVLLEGWFRAFRGDQNTRISFGLALFDADRNRLTGPAGERFVWGVEAIPVTPVVWTEYARVFGSGPTAARPLFEGARYARMVIRVHDGTLYFGTPGIRLTPYPQP